MKLSYVSLMIMSVFSLNTLAQNLSINVENIKSTKGFLYVALHNSETTWMKQGIQGQKLPVTEKVVKVVFRDLPASYRTLRVFQQRWWFWTTRFQ
jgi:uncharacterized protein (DUF2141 family)